MGSRRSEQAMQMAFLLGVMQVPVRRLDEEAALFGDLRTRGYAVIHYTAPPDGMPFCRDVHAAAAQGAALPAYDAAIEFGYSRVPAQRKTVFALKLARPVDRLTWPTAPEGFQPRAQLRGGQR